VILEWLAQDFKDLLARDHRVRVILWFDAKGEFQNLLPKVEERLQAEGMVLLALNKAESRGVLWLKWATEMGPGSGQKVVLWLPYSEKDLPGSASDGTRLDILLEYKYSGLIWHIDGKPPTLFGFLKKHGVPLPTRRIEQDPLWRGGADSPLAKYVGVHLGREADFWQSRKLTQAVVEESIIGNLVERLLQFLADPHGEWEALKKAGIANEFCSQVSVRYAETEFLPNDPQTWAKEFVTSLALLEVYEATGESGDFPFATKLPSEPKRPFLREFLRHWMRDRDHLESYRRWALELEKFLDLRDWAKLQKGNPQALRSLAKDRWARFLEGLRAQGQNENALKSYLREYRESLSEESKGFWASGTGDLPGWALAVTLVQLAEETEEAVDSVANMKTPSEFIEAYTRKWHLIDLRHWRLLSGARRAEEMELLAAIADRFYIKYLDETGRAFYESFKEDGVWPPKGCKSIIELATKLYEATGQKAILFVDSLRFDLAAALLERLGEGELEAFVANVPSQTYVGMTSLLPRNDVHLKVEEGTPILPWESGGDLTYRQNRWKVLESAGASPLGRDKKGARRDEIRNLWELTEAPKNPPPLLVLFERGVDGFGHGAGNSVILHFEELLGDLERAIRRLRAWGYAEIHVVTDHGFILLYSAVNIQPMEVDKDRFAIMDSRYGILKHGEKVATAIVPFPLDPVWSVALTPGLRSFSAPGKFFHGGATLQEVVIPHLSVRTPFTQKRMKVRTLVPQIEIARLFVKIELQPERPTPTGLFEEEPEAIKVEVFLGTSETRRSNVKVIEVRPEGKELIGVTLFINREPPTPSGTEIPVQVIDAESGESYSSGLFVRAIRDLE